MRERKEKIKVLFVCMGNICRSPTAHGMFRQLVADEGLDHAIMVDSAGTHSYHAGSPPDPRAQETARRRGVELGDLRARQAVADDFHRFDLVLAMDRDHHSALERLADETTRNRLHLFMEFASDNWRTREVPDPYYGGPNGFETVFDMVEEASLGLLEYIRGHYRL